ncbi:histidine kinase [Salinivibrio sp. AR647]|jgi:Predicted NTPase (NACHT family)|uniref:NACHT domain-containing protein n=1 Tax=Salinivibrio sp. AR647 TaxID=1909438 RepID=UPI000986174D|nr:NACHT domain-containing protein [Salinivibrio sp. AR647]OOE91933.1 histidine kinase [Salinivibrio sp. AR647]
MLEEMIKKATGGIDGLVDDLVKSASDKVKEKINEAFSIHKLTALKENIGRVGRVKTILDPDSIVDLDNIFFEDAITFEESGRVKNVSFFPSKQILIEGGPGQGKSLYLRWLCLNEGAGSNHIPIFIEFRNLTYQKSLKKDLFHSVRDFGVDLSDDLFDFLAKSKKIVFILDGFDEIPNSERLRVARELETIARTYPDLRIVISSRPDSGMGASVYFEKYTIKRLSKEYQRDFVNHLYKNGSQAEAINTILASNNFLTEVTNTPLLLTLFTITYNARQFKPDSLAEFYSLIFPTMLYRHDRLKIGYERERKAGLTDYQMQRIFEALSFISLKSNSTRFPSSKFRLFLDNAAKLERINENLEDLLIDDISSITALIIRDGFDYYSFSHKSIQEYFSAVFLSRLSDQRKVAFYKLVINDFDEYRKWQNSLAFLSTIDENDYKKYFLLPFKRNALNLDSNRKVKIDYKSLLRMIGVDTKAEVSEDGKLVEVYWGDTSYSVVYEEYSRFTRSMISKYLKRKRANIANFLSFCETDDYENYLHENGNFIFSIDSFLKGEKLTKESCSYLSEKFEFSPFKAELDEAEKELLVSEVAADDILQF